MSLGGPSMMLEGDTVSRDPLTWSTCPARRELNGRAPLWPQLRPASCAPWR
jgi:hypothetical protein